jgi:hypothetical protein
MNAQALLQVLHDTRGFVALPTNNFDWSSWKDADAALQEIDALIESVANRAKVDAIQLRVLFAPTGPLQEVSLRSGWSDAFFALAERFDAASR